MQFRVKREERKCLGWNARKSCTVELTSKIVVVSWLDSPGSLFSVKTSKMLDNFCNNHKILMVIEVPFPSYLKMVE